MDICFEQFSTIIDQIEITPINTIKLELQKVYTKFQCCSKKMIAASKFIDFFVHDILDYTILNRDSLKFVK